MDLRNLSWFNTAICFNKNNNNYKYIYKYLCECFSSVGLFESAATRILKKRRRLVHETNRSEQINYSIIHSQQWVELDHGPWHIHCLQPFRCVCILYNTNLPDKILYGMIPSNEHVTYFIVPEATRITRLDQAWAPAFQCDSVAL